MSTQAELHLKAVQALQAAKPSLPSKKALIGLDGFVDEIVRVVDKRESIERYSTIAEITRLANRVLAAAGKSTNIELIVEQIKTGGNGPIMASAAAALGLQVTYIGNLGYPNLHPVFQDLATRAELISIAEPAHTDALEFDDGKLMLGKLENLSEVSWENLLQRVGIEKLIRLFQESDPIGLVNWTMITNMSDIWQHLLQEVAPAVKPADRLATIFFDLADPEKRSNKDIYAALQLMTRFQKHFRVILGLNEKEAHEVANVLGILRADPGAEALREMSATIRSQLSIDTVVVHPREYAVAANASDSAHVTGPFAAKPYISTGGGDHFNAGFCLGAILDLPLDLSLLIGAAASGYYVRTAKSPSVDELIPFIDNWPQ